MMKFRYKSPITFSKTSIRKEKDFVQFLIGPRASLSLPCGSKKGFNFWKDFNGEEELLAS
jgi:hypothetical protein